MPGYIRLGLEITKSFKRKTLAAFATERKERCMDDNVNYLGLINMLQILQNAGLISKAEAKRVAARLKVEIGADIIISI